MTRHESSPARASRRIHRRAATVTTPTPKRPGPGGHFFKGVLARLLALATRADSDAFALTYDIDTEEGPRARA